MAVMTELEDFFYESIRKRRRTKACGRRRERAEEKEKTAKEAGRKRGHRKKRPTKKRVDEFYF